MRAKAKKSVLIFLFAAFSFSLPGVCANSLYTKLVEALSGSMPRLYVEEMAEKNSGKRIGGSAELVSVSVNTKGHTVAYLRPRDAESVGIAVFVLPNKAKYVRSLPSGHRTKFVGTFVGLTMNTLVVKNGYVR